LNNQKKVLVTGSAGFIGMHIALKLVKTGYDVLGIDNLNSYYDVNLKFARLKEQGIDKNDIEYNKLIIGTSNIKFLKLDITDKQNLDLLFETEQFDYVVHLAAQAGVRYSIENPQVYIDSNIHGFLNILENCKKTKIKHLIFASSSSVYGNNQNIPFSENDSTDYPISLYAATKKSNEVMAHSYAVLYGLPITGLRFFTVYGPWGRPDMALFKFTEKIMNGELIDVYNYGNLSRDFTYIDDIVEGIVQLIIKMPWIKIPYNIFNIGRGEPVVLEEFISAIELAVGKQAIRNDLPMQAGDVERTWASTVKLNDLLGYLPKIKVKEGVTRFVNWYYNYYKID
jgi:UDP-glucuronate 4-epimerase